ncbi:MAG: SDR family oxidoreductase [Cytophagales bacterium]
MDLNLQGKRAIVCGGSQGIGLAIAKQFAAQGANVTIISRDTKHLNDALSQLDISQAQQHHTLMMDFGSPEEVRAVIKNYAKNNPDVQILVNNSGGPRSGKILDIGTDEFKEAFLQHLVSDHLMAKTLVPLMQKNGYGRIINILSISVKEPIKNLGVSNAVRAAVANWAKTLAEEVAIDGITVNNILPGPTETKRIENLIEDFARRRRVDYDTVKKEMEDEIPLKRFAKAEEIANVVGFIASPAASYINGINLPVDGGKLASL